MKYLNIIAASLLLFSLTSCSKDAPQSELPSSQATKPTIINLTQVGCQFLETETKNYQYKPQKAENCEKINAETLASRKSKFKPLELQPGQYIFRVTNANVPYDLGFWLRGTGIKKVSLPKISGGGLTQGTTKDYEIELKTGEYVFSCPLNPTPDYPITVN